MKLATLIACALATTAGTATAAPKPDWLLDPTPYRAVICASSNSLTLDNGLVRRALRLSPNAATVDFSNLVTGEQLLRAVGPEARVTLNGTDYAIGGLEGQPIQNYLKAEWIDNLHANPTAYKFAGWRQEPMVARFPWKKRPEWLSKDLPWPAPGKHVALRFVPPTTPATLAGKVLFEDAFEPPALGASWKPHASDKHARSSFSNEGKPGEIYALPDTAVYAQRDWPAGAVTAEVTVDVGDDTRSNSFGPGLALVAPGRSLSFVARPNQQKFDINGAPQELGFDRSKRLHLRVRLEHGQAYCEAAQDGTAFKVAGSVEFPDTPTALRVGKVGPGGSGVDYRGAKGEALARCHVSHVTLRMAEPAEAAPAPQRTDLPEITVHYVLYDGIPLLEKWLTIRNASDKPVRVNKMLSETLKVNETEAIADPNINMELSTLYVESDYAFLAMNAKSGNKQAVKWLQDPGYHTQTSYFHEAICRVEVGPEFGPDTDVPPGGTMTSVRAFELARDGTDRERRGLAQRRMYRIVAPWSQENPVMSHLVASDPATIRRIVDQAAEVGMELVILSFGSGMNMESRDPAYQARYKEVADYARSKGVVLGAYSLLASRGAASGADNCGGPGARIRYGVMPCLAAKWGQDYLAQIRAFLTNTGFACFENDGSYPGDTCAHTDHAGHHGLADSQWTQFQAICGLYQWCRANGVYLNVPDWYFMNGSSKTAMGYREGNWGLPRAEQEIIERQNIYDSTWEKTSSMGWMFVPLTSYNGGAASTIEPLKDHLPHYEARLADLFGSGTQACYRGPRIYDTDETKNLVKKWVSFYKRHRAILDSDIIHLRRADGRDLDYILHVDPAGKEKGLLMIYNPLQQPVSKTLTIPLYYTGLTATARVSEQEAPAKTLELDRQYRIALPVTVAARGVTWFVIDSARGMVPSHGAQEDCHDNPDREHNDHPQQ